MGRGEGRVVTAVAPRMRAVVKVRVVLAGGAGGFVVRLDVGDKVVDAVQMLSREVEVDDRLDPVKLRRNCREDI